MLSSCNGESVSGSTNGNNLAGHTTRCWKRCRPWQKNKGCTYSSCQRSRKPLNICSCLFENFGQGTVKMSSVELGFSVGSSPASTSGDVDGGPIKHICWSSTILATGTKTSKHKLCTNFPQGISTLLAHLVVNFITAEAWRFKHQTLDGLGRQLN